MSATALSLVSCTMSATESCVLFASSVLLI